MEVFAAFSTSGESVGTVSANLIGSNLLFHNDDLSSGADFEKVTEQFELGILRYPGGTITEEYFDLTNPNASDSYNILDLLEGTTNIRKQSVIPLSDFLEFAHNKSIDPAIVIPTYRFFDPSSGGVLPDAEAEVRTFIRSLLTGEFGPIGQVTFELGNEWYQERFAWTVEQFGEIQSKIAEWIFDEVSALGLKDTVTILAQAGRNEADNACLASYFNGEGTINGVLTHLYGTNSNGNPLGIGSGIGRRLEEIRDVWGSVLGSDFSLAVTEWNVGENGIDDTTINGLMRSAPLLRIFSEMVEKGVDLAAIWASQTNGPAGLSGVEGTGSALSPTGYLYTMLDDTIGYNLADNGAGPFLHDANGNKVGYNYIFENDSGAIHFLSSGSSQPMDLTVDLTYYKDADAFIYATILRAAPGEAGDEYWSDASLNFETEISNLTGSSWHVPFQLSAYETLQIQIVLGSGVQIEGDRHHAIDDALTGSEYGDYLAGHLGGDSLLGEAGDDTLLGGIGDDLIYGGDDHDFLEGGDGSDSLFGGHGRDTLSGGLGNDLIEGGNWNDTIFGGTGDDTIIGGRGDDSLFGGDGDDFVEIGNGNDVAVGVSGFDILALKDSQDQALSLVVGAPVLLSDNHTATFSGFEALVGTNSADQFLLNISEVQGATPGADGGVVIRGGSSVFASGVVGMSVYGGAGDDALILQDNTAANDVPPETHSSRALEDTIWLSGGIGDDFIFLANQVAAVVEFRPGDGSDSVSGFDFAMHSIQLEGYSPEDVSLDHLSGGTLLNFNGGDSIFIDDLFLSQPDLDLFCLW